MNIGNLLRELRLERKITQQQLADGISSQPALSRMENSDDLPVNLLLPFLAKLNIRPIEFFMLAKNEHVIKSQSFLQNKKRAFYDKKIMEQLVRNEMNTYENTGLIKHKINAIRVRAVYCKIHNLPLEDEKEIAKQVKEYLLQFDSWVISDISLYIDLLFIFENELIRAFHRRVLKSLEELPMEPTYKHGRQISYATNAVMLAFERKNFTDLNIYLNTYHNFLTNDPNLIFEKIQYSIYTKLFDLIRNYNQDDHCRILKEIQIFKNYGLEETSDIATNLINEYLTELFPQSCGAKL